MSKKNVLICGATGGIGRAIVKQLLSEGAEICGIFSNPEKAAVIAESGVSLYQIDLSDTSAVQIGFKDILNKHPLFDVVVYSVSGQLKYQPFLDTTWSEYAKHNDLQVKGLHNVMQGLREQIQNGHSIKFIILLTEACIGKPPAGFSSYVSAKYALLGMAKSMTVELAKYGCTVNLVSPGMTETGLIKSFPSKLIEIQAAANPLHRIASPQDVANVVCFLVKSESDYLNGVNIPVNGGQVLS